MPIGTDKIALMSGGGSNTPETLELLVIAGGGCGQPGGSEGGGGGGGGGGERYFTAHTTPAGSFTVTIGEGGVTAAGSKGQNSVFDTITSSGGGFGRGPCAGGTSCQGGAGGGGSGTIDTPQNIPQNMPGGEGNIGGFTPSEGADGGTGRNGGNQQRGGGGGGGGGGDSGGGGGGYGGEAGGAGGAGTSRDITGSSVQRVGGGGGGGSPVGGAGAGGGGTGGQGGTTNYGGGGGGTGWGPTGSGGGSGIVIIAYADTLDDLSSVGGSLTCNGSAGNAVSDTSTRSGYKLYQFTAGSDSCSF